MKSLKRLIAGVLIVCMILTSHAFFVFAEGVEESTSEQTTVTDITTIDETISLVASSSDASDLGEEENESTTYAEEPEVDETIIEETTTEESMTEESTTEESTSVEASLASQENVGASTGSQENVGASTASPDESITEESTTIDVGASTASQENVGASTASPDEEPATVSEIIVVEATKSETIVATISEMNLFGASNDTFWFGVYPQNDASGNQLEPIPWRLIRLMGDGTAIFTSYPILSKAAWHEVEDPDVSWKNCDLRNWLNNDFIIKAFTTKQIISDLMVNREDVDELDGSTYNIGKVFLLDLETVNTCFSSNEDRVAWPTAYAETLTDVGYNDWWLRNRFISVAVERGFTRFVYRTGDTEERIEGMNNASYCVRPAICLKMDSSLYRPGSVSWNLGDSSFKSESRLWNDFDNYFGGQKLPTAINMIEQPGKEFKGWKINDGNTIYSEIPVNQTGDITLTPVWETLSLKYLDRYFGIDLTNYFENYNPELVHRPNGKFPYLADYSQGDIFEDYYIEELLYRDGDGKFKPIPYNGEINPQNRTVYVVGSRGVLPPYLKTITDFELILDNVITKYKEGETLNVDGLIIKITLANGETIRIAYSEELSQFFKFYPSIDQLLNSNVKEVGIEFGSLTAKYSIEVEKKRTSSGGGSGGSGGGGVIKSIQNTMFNDLPIMTTTIQTTKTINALVSMLSSNWIKNEISGKWMLSSKTEDRRTWMLSDGFYCVVRYENEEPVVDTYYFNDAGELVTGFVNTIDNNRYFFEVTQNGNEGKMVKGWRSISNKWYYFGEDGAMYRYSMTPDGYFVDSNGEYVE